MAKDEGEVLQILDPSGVSIAQLPLRMQILQGLLGCLRPKEGLLFEAICERGGHGAEVPNEMMIKCRKFDEALDVVHAA